MKNKIFCLITLLVLCLLLAGCSLAREDQTLPPDELTGVMVRLGKTNEYGRLEPSPFSSAGDLDIDPDPFYPVTEAVYDRCLLLEKYDDGIGTNAGSWFSGVHSHFSEADEEKSVALSATVYLDPETAYSNQRITISPVYRRADGSLYALNDTNGFMGDLDGFQTKFSAEKSETDQKGSTFTDRCSFEVSVQARPRVERLRLIEMDENNRPLSAQEVDLLSSAPLRVSANAAWVLAEEYAVDGHPGEAPFETLLREAVSLKEGKGELSLYLPVENGILSLRAFSIEAE